MVVCVPSNDQGSSLDLRKSPGSHVFFIESQVVFLGCFFDDHYRLIGFYKGLGPGKSGNSRRLTLRVSQLRKREGINRNDEGRL